MLKAVFHQGLNTEVLRELTCRDGQVSLNSLIDMVIHLNNLICNHQACQVKVNPTSPTDDQKPMQIARTKLSPTEHNQRRERLIFYCGAPIHALSQCPTQGRSAQSRVQVERTITSPGAFSVRLSQFVSDHYFAFCVQIKHLGSISVLSTLTDS